MIFLVFLHTEMKRIIYSKFDKSKIPTLPTVVFEGRIFVITTPSEAQKAVNYLLSMPILGVDTETRPSFRKGQSYQVSLLQVSTYDTCFLFRLNRLGLNGPVKRLLEDTTVPKIGLSWHDDLTGLRRLGNFVPGLFIDIQDHVREIGIEDLSLQKLYANMFGKNISKRERLTNWETETLNDKQKQYAAIDAWACIQLYEELLRLKVTRDYELITEEETKSDEANISEER